jgi:predicted metal-dependent hydrolase
MSVHAVPGTDIAYHLRRSGRARRLRIVVRPERVEVVAPPGLATAAIESFVREKAGWVARTVERLRRGLHPNDGRLEDGAHLLLRGRPVPLRVSVSEGARVTVRERNGLEVRAPAMEPSSRERLIERALERFLRGEARKAAESAIGRFGPPNGLVPRALLIKGQRTLWGSCTARGDINLNWRLVLAPPAVLDYVVAHELCHLRERNHQRPFWRLVERIMPDYAERRAWLRAHGHRLTLGPCAPDDNQGRGR